MNRTEMEKIDFVITWVDGSDPVWLAEKKKWEDLLHEENNQTDDANSARRYRADDASLRYWFRSVERFAPWVNKIHFVTCGQKPEWLNENHPKLNLVNHADHIPSKYLPTFNANTIEMNFQRIEELADRFVLFNDDVFLLRPVAPEFFFKEGKPVLKTDLRYTNVVGYNNWSRLLFNGYCLVNQSFDTRKSIWDHRKKWFNVKELGLKRVRQNLLCYLANKTIPVGTYGHLANPHLKSTLAEVWEKWPEVMDNMSSHKFRADDQVNQWMLCTWNQAKGCFYPAHEKNRGISCDITSYNMGWMCETIKNQRIPQICINDTKSNDTDPEESMREICKAFATILPEKSSFEKG